MKNRTPEQKGNLILIIGNALMVLGFICVLVCSSAASQNYSAVFVFVAVPAAIAVACAVTSPKYNAEERGAPSREKVRGSRCVRYIISLIDFSLFLFGMLFNMVANGTKDEIIVGQLIAVPFCLFWIVKDILALTWHPVKIIKSITYKKFGDISVRALVNDSVGIPFLLFLSDLSIWVIIKGTVNRDGSLIFFGTLFSVGTVVCNVLLIRKIGNNIKNGEYIENYSPKASSPKICFGCHKKLHGSAPCHIVNGKTFCMSCYQNQDIIKITRLFRSPLSSKPMYVVSKAQGKNVNVPFIELIINSVNSPIWNAVPSDRLLVPGDELHCRFAISDEQVNWIKTAPEKLNELARKLEKQIPADLYIEAFVLDKKTRKAREITVTASEANAYKSTPDDSSQSKLEELKKTAYLMKKEGKEDKELKQYLIKIVDELLREPNLHFLFDNDCNLLPYVDPYGYIEVFTNINYANEAIEHFNNCNEANLIVSDVIENLADFLNRMYYNGVWKLRIDTGHFPVELEFSDIIPLNVPVAHFIDTLHIPTRACLLRMTEMEARSKKGIGNKVTYKTVYPVLQKNAFEKLKSAPLYALCIGMNIPDTTLYSDEALKQFKNNAEAEGKALPVGQNNRYSVIASVDGVSLKTVLPRNTPAGLKNSFVPVFTGYAYASEAFNSLGLTENDGIIIMTFDELSQKAKECKGLVVDCTSYGYEIWNKK